MATYLPCHSQLTPLDVGPSEEDWQHTAAHQGTHTPTKLSVDALGHSSLPDSDWLPTTPLKPLPLHQ
jgi:hypothetical protein